MDPLVKILETLGVPPWTYGVLLFGIIMFSTFQLYLTKKLSNSVGLARAAFAFLIPFVFPLVLTFLISWIIGAFLPLHRVAMMGLTPIPTVPPSAKFSPTPTSTPIQRIAWRTQTDPPPTMTLTSTASIPTATKSATPTSSPIALVPTATVTPPPQQVRSPSATPMPPCFKKSDQSYHFLGLYDGVQINSGQGQPIVIQAVVSSHKYRFYELRFIDAQGGSWSPNVEDWNIIGARTAVPDTQTIWRLWWPSEPGDYYIWLVPYTVDGNHDSQSQDCKVRVSYR